MDESRHVHFHERILNALPDPVFVKDRDHRWIFLNDACCTFWRCGRAQIIGKSDYDVFPREQADLYWKKDEEVFRERKPILNIEAQTIEGEVHTIATMKSFYADESTGGEFIIGTIRDVSEHLRADALLRESEEKFRNLAEHSPNMIFINAGGKVVYVNKKCEQLLGCTKEEFLSDDFDFERIIAPDSRQVIARAFASHNRGEDIPPYEYGILSREGRRIDVIITSKLITYEGQRAILGIVTDISVLKTSEKLLRESEENYRNLLELAPLGIVTVDLNGNVLSVNSAFSRLTGYSRGELIGMHFSCMPNIDTRYTRGFGKIFTRIVEGRNPDPFRFRYRRKDGSLRWLQVWTAGIVKNGEIVGVQAILQDVTEHRDYEENLRSTEILYRLTIDSLGDALHLVDRDLRVVLCNRTLIQWNATYGFPTDVHGRRLGDVYPFLSPAVLKEYDRMFRTGASMVREEHNVVDGHTIVTETARIPITENGRVTKILTVLHDVTEQRTAVEALKESEEMLRHAQKMEAIGRLAGGVAHDFNNLLTAILGYTDMLSCSTALGKREKKFVSEVRRSAERAGILTQRLLAFGRKQVLQPKIVDLNSLVINLKSMLTRIIGEDVRLVTLLEPRLARVRVDPGQIEHVIVNLAVNARDALPRGGIITITTWGEFLSGRRCHLGQPVPDGEYVLFSVQDNGTGIEEKISRQIFEPFFTTKEKDRGTGLGLSTVYGIVEQSMGYIFLDSTVGVGTTIAVALPVCPDGKSEEPSRRPENRPAGGSESVLVVEDEQLVRNMISSSLRSFGYTVHEASEASEALERFDRIAADLVITDVIMPGMNGGELVELLKKRRAEQKILFISGYTGEAIGRFGVLDRGTYFLQKPFTPVQLAEKVRCVLDDR
jgi:two-component system cell cycle sensor histidine kinase/response regulator CckA